MRIKILFFICFFVFVVKNAQVGINTIQPNSNSALHISEKMTSTDPDSENKIKGIIIPRLTEQERNRLTYSDPDTKQNIRLQSSDNGLTIFNTTENCYNFWNSTENSWKSSCGGYSDAAYTLDCTSVSVTGSYVANVPANESNYININNINVTKAGNYIISASTDTNNGYSFIAIGVFLNTGIHSVKLMAQGTPLNSQMDNFTIKLSGAGVQPQICTANVSVQQSIAEYSMICSSAKANGTYQKGVALVAGNTITMNVNVTTTGYFEIKTLKKNGISFSASGNFNTTGPQQITLVGSGTPSVNEDFQVKVSGNTGYGNTDCDVNIPVILPSMTYAVIGLDNVYTFHPNNPRTASFNSGNFGLNGVVKISGLSNIWVSTNANSAVTNLNAATKPDVVLYFSYGFTANSAMETALSNYVNAGGVLIFGSNDGRDGDVNNLMNGIFGETYAQSQVAGSGSVDDNVYPISNLPNDPIINGPFGNAAAQYWGEDNSSTGTVILTKLPANSVQIATANNQFSKNMVNPSYSTVWYNKTKNFVYFGDSVGASNNSLSLTDYPSLYDSNMPVSKRYGQFPNQSTQAQYVFNSILELNAFAWGLRRAAVSGINPH